jgi:hypothetical protein
MGLLARLRRRDNGSRFRSAERMRVGDEERLEAVRAAIRSVIAAIEREHAGLSRRIDEISGGAAGLYGTGSESYETRSSAEEQALADLERQLVWAMRRLDELEAQRTFFERSLTRFAKVEPEVDTRCGT